MMTWRTVFENGARKFLRCAIGARKLEVRIIPGSWSIKTPPRKRITPAKLYEDLGLSSALFPGEIIINEGFTVESPKWSYS